MAPVRALQRPTVILEMNDLDFEGSSEAVESAFGSPSVQRVVSERECARCGSQNPISSLDCVRCGVVFEKSVSGGGGRPAVVSDLRVEEELALGGSRELAALWDLVVEDYEDRIRHERFVTACRAAGGLSYAVKKYSQILVATPQDEIAQTMRNRAVALISLGAEKAGALPFRMAFQVPRFNNLILAIGGALVIGGILVPRAKNVMEIGMSAILLAVGIRMTRRERA